MNKERMLTLLVLADVFLAFAVIGSDLVLGWTLPDPLQRYIYPQALSFSGGPAFLLLMLWSMTVSCTVVAWVGLLNLWRFARRLYLVGWAMWVLLLLLSGPSVMTSLGAMLSTVEAVVGGAIVGLVYFSDLSRHFERRVAGIPATA